MRGLGQLEATVMNFVWGAPGPVTVRDVVEALQQDRSIAYTTVMTVMDNLHSKGFLGRERVGTGLRVPADPGARAVRGRADGGCPRFQL